MTIGLSDAERIAIAAALGAYAGDPEEGRALRARVAALQPLKGKTGDRAERAVQVAANAYGSRRPIPLKDVLDLAPLLDPFVGDSRLVGWPHQDPTAIPDDAAVRWLEWLARAGCLAIPEPALLEFVLVMFRTRRRETWVPASRALAALARRDAEARAAVETLWTRWYPRGLPGAWDPFIQDTGDDPGGGDGPDDWRAAHDAANRVHMLRHVLHLGCAWLAIGGEPSSVPGLDPAGLAATPLPPGDQATASTILLALGLLAGAECTRPAVLECIEARASEAPQEPQVEDALRSLASTVSQAARAAGAVRARLIRADLWQRAAWPAQADALWSWIETAAWFQGRGDVEAVAAMEAQAGPAAEAFALRVHGTLPGNSTDAVEALLPVLRGILDTAVRETTQGARRAAAFVVAWQLFQHPDVAALPWDHLAARALGRPADRPWTDAKGEPRKVSAVWRPEMALRFGRKPPAILLRDACFEEAVVLDLATSRNRFVAIQAAVQAERLLREAPGPAARVRLMWRLLLRDPDQRFFEELRTIIRWNDAHLGRLVEAFQAMDKERDENRARKEIKPTDYGKLSDLYERIAKATAAALHGAGTTSGPPGAWLCDVIETMKRAPERQDVGSATWLEWFRGLLLGDGAGGIAAWLDWVAEAPGAAALSGELQAAWVELREAVTDLRSARPSVRSPLIERVEKAVEGIERVRDRIAWPEAAILAGVVRQLAPWLEDCREDLRRRIRGIVETARKDRAPIPLAALHEAAPGDASWAWTKHADPDVIRYAHESLVERGRYAEADDLRAAVRGNPDLPPTSTAWNVVQDIRDSIRDGREDKLVDEVRRPAAAKIPRDVLLEAHRFLLERLNFTEARRLAKPYRSDARFESMFSFLRPLIAAVTAGPILLLDVGSEWNKALVEGRAVGGCALVAIVALVAAFGFTWTSLMPRRAQDAGPEAAGARRSMLARILAVYGGALALAGVSSCLVLLTVPQLSEGARGWTMALQILLWSALSLFLGQFFQIVLERRGATNRS